MKHVLTGAFPVGKCGKSLWQDQFAEDIFQIIANRIQ